MTTYKPHYACFACRKAFRRRLRADQRHPGTQSDQPARCPQCRLLMANMGLDFKPPPQSDEKAWEIVGKLWEVGVTFHSCGCGGPGYRPRDPRAYHEFLQQMLLDYQGHLRRWMDGEPRNPREAKDKEAAIVRWRERIASVQAAISAP